MPNHTKLKREDGTTASSAQKPDMLADHLEKKQWAKPNSLAEQLPTIKIFDTITPLKTIPFTIDELEATQKLMKTGKATGPNKQASELNKWLEGANKVTVLEIINLMWETETLEKSLEDADIVSIYKKGNATDPANYRPIALLNSIYKLYAAMIKTRMA